MVNQSGLWVLTNDNPRRKASAFGMMKVMLVVLMLLASSLGRANALGMASLLSVADAPDCGSQPICGYIQAHSLDKLLTAAPECGNQPICGYLLSHNLAGNLAATTPLSAVLFAQSKLAAYDAQLSVANSTLVRSGPGESFYSYGELPVAYVSQVIGVSQLGNWLAIPLPKSAAPDGLGWIEAASVNTSNVDITLMDPPACSEYAYCGYLIAHNQVDQPSSAMNCGGQPICGYLQAHNRQNLPVLAPSFATEFVLGQPVIAVTGLCRPTQPKDC